MNRPPGTPHIQYLVSWLWDGSFVSYCHEVSGWGNCFFWYRDLRTKTISPWPGTWKRKDWVRKKAQALHVGILGLKPSLVCNESLNSNGKRSTRLAT